jgi:glutamate N-acetyltransferase/amino-acid N-acetyltransferase
MDDFRTKLFALMKDLAVQVVRDGEGAQHLVRINVNGAESQQSAKKIALAVANSPLVKTAIAGNDANWGRIVMAVGKAGEPADRDKLEISFGEIRVATQGERDPAYSEAATSAYMKNEDIDVRVGLGLGAGTATVYTCDLTHGYITINGDYRS